MKVEVITPRKIEFQGEAEDVILPTLSGEIAVLSFHAPLISVLKAGRIRIKNEAKENVFEIEGGVVEVENNKATILLKKFNVQ